MGERWPNVRTPRGERLALVRTVELTGGTETEMGDRANVVVLDEHAPVFLYTHWGGEDLPTDLANALARGKDRWDDGPYLTRIIFCEMVKGQEGETTGFGISTVLCDNEHPLLVVRVSSKHVWAVPEKYADDLYAYLDDHPTEGITFSDATPDALQRLFGTEDEA